MGVLVKGRWRKGRASEIVSGKVGLLDAERACVVKPGLTCNKVEDV